MHLVYMAIHIEPHAPLRGASLSTIEHPSTVLLPKIVTHASNKGYHIPATLFKVYTGYILWLKDSTTCHIVWEFYLVLFVMEIVVPNEKKPNNKW